MVDGRPKGEKNGSASVDKRLLPDLGPLLANGYSCIYPGSQRLFNDYRRTSRVGFTCLYTSGPLWGGSWTPNGPLNILKEKGGPVMLTMSGHADMSEYFGGPRWFCEVGFPFPQALSGLPTGLHATGAGTAVETGVV